MKSSDFSQLGVVTVVLLLLVSTAPAAALTGGGSAPASDQVADQAYYTVTSDVDVWERAPLPLRTDPATAETVVETHNVFVNFPEMNTGDAPVNKQELAVYGSESEISVQFQEALGADTTAFAGEDVQLLAAKVGDADDVSGMTMWSNLPESFNQPLDLLRDSAVSESATFELVDAGTVSEEGAVDVTYDLSEANRGAGQYVFFLVANGADEDGMVVDSGELSVTGDSSVLGVDMAVAQQRSSGVAPTQQSVEAGENVSFDLATSDSTADLTHTVVLYNESTYSDSRMVVDISGDLNGDISEDNVQLSHSVDDVNGALHVVDNSDAYARTGSLNLTEFMGFGQTETDLSISDEDPSETVVLDASMTTGAGSASSVPVETLSNWSDGEYRWVHLATAANGSVVSTEAGTVTVGATSDDSGSDDNDGGSNDGGADDDDNDSNDNDDDPSSSTGDSDNSDSTDADSEETDNTTPFDGVTSLKLTSTGAEAQISQANANGEYELDFTEQPIESNGVSVNGLTLQMGESAGNFSVSTSLVETMPEDISQPPTETAGIISVETDAPESAFTRGEFRFTVSQERLDELEMSVDDVALYRYHDGEWTELETSHVNGSEFVAETPGFSYFAIGSSSEAGGEGRTGTAGDSNDLNTVESGETPTDEEEGSGFPASLIAVLAIVAIAAAAGVVYTRQNR